MTDEKKQDGPPEEPRKVELEDLEAAVEATGGVADQKAWNDTNYWPMGGHGGVETGGRET